MSRFGRGFVIATAILAAAGCAGRAAPSASPQIQPAWTSCADAQDTAATPPAVEDPAATPPAANNPTGLPRLGEGFDPVAVVVCSAMPFRPGGGQDHAATESRADDVTALVAALRLPDQPHSGEACTLELYLPPFFALLDSQGRWVHPGLPTDSCGKVRIEVREALQGLRLTPTSSRPMPEIESSEAAAAGCTQQWADMIWATAGTLPTSEPAVVPAGFDGPVPVRLCVYRVPADQQGTGKPAGDFTSGRYLSDDQWAIARREIESAAPARPCATPASRFAVLHIAAGQIYAELDGCRRLLAPSADGRETVRQPAPALAGLLAGR
jgi:hypothetical protein